VLSLNNILTEQNAHYFLNGEQHKHVQLGSLRHNLNYCVYIIIASSSSHAQSGAT